MDSGENTLEKQLWTGSEIKRYILSTPHPILHSPTEERKGLIELSGIGPELCCNQPFRISEIS